MAHRLSTIREADLIYVLHRGRVAEAGTHQQLVAREGQYWALCQAQVDDEARSHRRPHVGLATVNSYTNGRA